MKAVKFLLFLALIAFIGGFGYFAFTDTQIEQNTVTVDIPYDKPLEN